MSARLMVGILAALRSNGVIGNKVDKVDGMEVGEDGVRRDRPVEISLNCGVSVAGCRNFVGVGARGEGKGDGNGRKRKAEEGEDKVEEPRSKKGKVEV